MQIHKYYEKSNYSDFGTTSLFPPFGIQKKKNVSSLRFVEKPARLTVICK